MTIMYLPMVRNQTCLKQQADVVDAVAVSYQQTCWFAAVYSRKVRCSPVSTIAEVNVTMMMLCCGFLSEGEVVFFATCNF